jgi:hypothetical protein
VERNLVTVSAGDVLAPLDHACEKSSSKLSAAERKEALFRLQSTEGSGTVAMRPDGKPVDGYAEFGRDPSMSCERGMSIFAETVGKSDTPRNLVAVLFCIVTRAFIAQSLTAAASAVLWGQL